ncbi:hypothetical protein ACM26V_16360 [Salipaludibacillus sp. HK11]|uniref:hypothetical protein n=1 Tax=Salipaludibacillus sp. HK11 TaxID=3394320 RepID=UPI0039FD4D6E
MEKQDDSVRNKLRKRSECLKLKPNKAGKQGVGIESARLEPNEAGKRGVGIKLARLELNPKLNSYIWLER